MTSAKAYVLEPMRALCRQHPTAPPTIYVDDIIVAAEGKECDVREWVVDSAAAVLDMVNEELRGQVAEAKVAIVASNYASTSAGHPQGFGAT